MQMLTVEPKGLWAKGSFLLCQWQVLSPPALWLLLCLVVSPLLSSSMDCFLVADSLIR